ncbi:hypothetical protein [Clostridium sp. DL1XJH146]
MDDKAKKYIIISIGIVVLSALLLPCFSPKSIDGVYKCSFGFPIAYFYINTMGNSSMVIPILLSDGKEVNFNLVWFALDIGIYYFVLSKCSSIFKNKRIGIGTLSIIVFVLAISFFISIEGYGIIGVYFLSKFGLKLNIGKMIGLNYSTIFPLILFLLSFFLGKRYRRDLGAELGTSLSAFMGVFLGLLLVVKVAF